MEIIKLNLIPSGVNPTCHCSQYDDGRVIRIELFDGLTPYVLQSGDTVTLNVRKPDNTIVTGTVSTTQGNNYVDIVTTEQICAVVGYNLCDLTITNGETVIGTLNFIMAVERDVLADGIPSQSVIEDLDALVAEAVGDNYYTKTEVDTALALKADKATTYTKTETDTLLNAKANSSDVYTKAQVDTALEGKADVDGDYKLMTVGNAEQLKSTVGEINKTPYNFRTSGGSLDIGDRETDKIIGGTIAFNQLIVNGNFANSDTWRTYNGSFTVANNEATITASASEGAIYQDVNAVVGHKYLVICSAKVGTATEAKLYVQNTGDTSQITSITASTFTEMFLIRNSSTATLRIQIRAIGEGLTAIFKNVRAFDLTQMFGATIADYIYSLEQGQAGAGVAWFKKLFPKSYYAYNAGELMSVKTSAHNMTGFNQFDKSTAITGKSINVYGDLSTDANYTTSDYIRVIENTNYYFHNVASSSVRISIAWYDMAKSFISTSNIYAVGNVASGARTVPTGACYARITIPNDYVNTCNVNISWDGERDGDYEPYELNSYALDSDLELRGIPKLDANNNLYYDGDIYESSGDVTRRYGIVDLGSLSWSYDSGNHQFYSAVISDGYDGSAFNTDIVSKYEAINANVYALPTRHIRGINGKRIYIVDGDYTDASLLKTSLSGVYCVYPLATPTTEQADAYQNPQIVNDFGTEEYLDTRDVAIPVGHDTFYQANLKAKLEMTPDAPENNGDYLMRHNNGENTYIPYTSPIPSAPTEDGTYTLKVTVSGGTPSLTWVQDT